MTQGVDIVGTKMKRKGATSLVFMLNSVVVPLDYLILM
jgi:hypothetical protein